MYIAGLMGAAALVACFIFVEETYPPSILVGKASELRRKTKNWGIHAKQEEVELDLRELLEKNVSRYVRLNKSLIDEGDYRWGFINTPVPIAGHEPRMLLRFLSRHKQKLYGILLLPLSFHDNIRATTSHTNVRQALPHPLYRANRPRDLNLHGRCLFPEHDMTPRLLLTILP